MAFGLWVVVVGFIDLHPPLKKKQHGTEKSSTEPEPGTWEKTALYKDKFRLMRSVTKEIASSCLSVHGLLGSN